MSRLFAVVHEAEADFLIATELADRVIVDATDDWVDEYQVCHERTWVATAPGDRRLTWTAIPHLAAEMGIKARGHFEGKPGEDDAANARRAILYLRQTIDGLAAIVLVRDQDDKPERREGLKQARDQYHAGTVIVIAFAVPMREAWVISGFDPENDDERARLAAERQALGSDPRTHAHELTAKDENATRSPKRVLRSLSGAEKDRERRCWMNAPLSLLRERGTANGLAAYREEVLALAKLIGYVAEN
jgi:hypothetical protein